MKQIHLLEKKQFKKLFKQEKIDRVEDRYRILEAFLQTEQHVTVEELAALLRRNGSDYPEPFVTDTLERLCDFGFAEANRFGNGEVRFEHRHLGQHHDHMVCTKCRRIIEFENRQMEALQSRIADAYGFMMLQHKMEIYGICADCLQSRAPHMPLVAAKQGERLTIKAFDGGSGARLRLLTMGLRVGDDIEVVTDPQMGQVVVAVGFNRYVLGRGLAEKILVAQTALPSAPTNQSSVG